MKRLVAALLLAALVLPPAPGRTADVGPCPGPAETTKPVVVTGTFDKEFQGSYVLVPFMVPSGATRVRVKICYDQPDIPLSAGPMNLRNVLDLGVYDRLGRDRFYNEDEFRGWGGSSRPNVLITPEDSTTVGFLPGRIPAGRWAAEIGVAAIGEPTEGNLDSAVNWRLEIFVASLASDLDHPWKPARYDTKPVNRRPGWYAGDVHVHTEHSFPAGATLRQTFDYAFKEAGLDFITLSDYGTTRHWHEIGRFQRDYRGHLIIRSAELITYRGHVNNHASQRYVDYRTGPIYERRAGGSFAKVRVAQPASRMFKDIHTARDRTGRARGWTQVNHPTIFPSQVPAFANLCRGCSWDYSDAETDWSQVDAFEVHTGPSGSSVPQGDEVGPYPFTPHAIVWYDALRRAGFDITAVGSSDSHRAGRILTIATPAGDLPFALSSPIGEATTVVYAPELSERGIRDGILAGHAYVKFFGPDGPDLRFTATPEGSRRTVMMGDELIAPSATLTASVLNAKPSAQPRLLLVIWNGVPIFAYPVTGESAEFEFPVTAPGDYRLQLMRGTAFEALTNPITVRTS